MTGMDNINELLVPENGLIALNVPLDEVLYMPIGQEILFRRGQRPIVTRRYDINKNPLYKQITEQYEQSLNVVR